MPFAFINGANLYYEETGTGTPILFVHAGIADSRMWDTQITAFSPQYRVIRMDLRGYGQSLPTEEPFSHREDVLSLMDALSIERGVLVGCSMSGKMAIDLTLDHPERVLALVAVAARPNGFTADVPPSPYEDDMEAAEEAGDLERLNTLELLYWVAGQGRTRADVDPYVWALAADMNRIALANEALSGEEKPPLDPPAVGRLHEIHVPVLIMCGDCDVQTIILAADAMEQGIAGSRKVMLKNAGHLPNTERPDEFNQALKMFLDEVL
jgi:2-hydroxy-6-oxonona-2,4-dienedioate hydrolase